MKKRLVYFCLLFVFTSCELIILDTYLNGNRSTVFNPNFLKEKIESLVDKYGLKDEETCLDSDGLYEGQLCYDENYNEMYSWNGVDWVLRNNEYEDLKSEDPGKQEIAFPEELINNYITSDCNNYNNFIEDALYFRKTKKDDSFDGVENIITVELVKNQLNNEGHYGIVEKVYENLPEGKLIIEISLHQVTSVVPNFSITIQNKSLRKLYNELYKSQLYTKSYEDFVKQFSDSTKQKKLYNSLNKDKLYTKSFLDFQEQFFSSPQDEEENEKRTLVLTKSGEFITVFDSTIEKELVTGQTCFKIPNKIKSKTKPKKQVSKPKIIDSDGDGIRDSMDKCPNNRGVISGFGCPDKDKDGIIDSKDSCPQAPGSERFSGCPDSDEDGVPDYIDNCTMEPGSSSNNGCPEPTVVQFIIVEKVPEFPACSRFSSKDKNLKCFNEQFNKHLKRNLKYPKSAKEMGVNGRIFFTLLIDEEGEIKKIKTFSRTKKNVASLQNEVYRVLKALPKMVPASHKGKNVSVPIARYVDFKKDGRKYIVSFAKN